MKQFYYGKQKKKIHKKFLGHDAIFLSTLLTLCKIDSNSSLCQSRKSFHSVNRQKKEKQKKNKKETEIQ